jgi:hypothetical protein
MTLLSHQLLRMPTYRVGCWWRRGLELAELLKQCAGGCGNWEASGSGIPRRKVGHTAYCKWQNKSGRKPENDPNQVLGCGSPERPENPPVGEYLLQNVRLDSTMQEDGCRIG